jgi:hypothetical protein
MTPGPLQIIACPQCNALASHTTLLSGNTLGATYWTDGKMIAPMLPDTPAVTQCQNCQKYYWVEDAEEVGEWNCFEGEPPNPAWGDVPEIEELSEPEYFQALEQGIAEDEEQEKLLRLFAWWRRNDAYREEDAETSALAPAADTPWKENLAALAELLDADEPEDRVMQAEIFRELGDFERALQILESITEEGLKPAVGQIKALCEKQETGVCRMNFED